MRHRTLGVAIAALAFPVLAGGVGANDENVDQDHGRPARIFRAVLLGTNEVPPISTGGHGRLRLELNRDETNIHFELSYQDLEGTPASVAHVHFAPSNVNGMVMFFMCGGGPAATPCPPSGTLEGDITAADIVGPAAQGITPGEFAEVVKALRAGLAYGNVHNAAIAGDTRPSFPGGQVRGQLVPSRR